MRNLDVLLRAIGEEGGRGNKLGARVRQLVDALRSRLDGMDKQVSHLREENRALREIGGDGGGAAGVTRREFESLQRQLTEASTQFALLKVRATPPPPSRTRAPAHARALCSPATSSSRRTRAPRRRSSSGRWRSWRS